MNEKVRELIKKFYAQNIHQQQNDWQKFSENFDLAVTKRVEDELTGAGPLAKLLANENISEILVNDYNKIFFEENGHLQAHDDEFYSPHSYLSYISRLSDRCNRPLNRERPFVETQLDGFRYSLIFSELTDGTPLISIRKPIKKIFNFENLIKYNWCDNNKADLIKNLIKNKKNILVVGSTSSGKTTSLQALLGLIEPNERCVIIEDAKELKTPNEISVSLLAREFGNGSIHPINLEELIKRALRFRPDRLIVGEVRGSEAYSLLLALSTGHRGSLSSLHAADAKQALLRLEMLIQLGAPQWDLRSIRRLITLSLDYILVVEKKDTSRILKEICEIKSAEENGIIIEKVY